MPAAALATAGARNGCPKNLIYPKIPLAIHLQPIVALAAAAGVQQDRVWALAC